MGLESDSKPVMRHPATSPSCMTTAPGVYILYLVGRYEFGAEGEERIKALRASEVAGVAAQYVLGGHIQHRCESRDEVGRVRIGDVLRLAPHHEGEFALGGHPFGLGRQHYLVARPDDSSVRPHKARRLLGGRCLG